MNELDESLDVVDRRARQNAVPQVEDVARAHGPLAQDLLCSLIDAFRRSEQHARVEVSLNRHIAQALSGVGQFHAEIHPRHVAARASERLEIGRGARAEVDDGSARLDARNQRAAVRQDELPEIARREATHPTVENLHRLRARAYLFVQIDRQPPHELFHQRAPRARIGVHEPLGVLEIARTAALYHVRREREGRAAKADEREGGVHPLPGLADRLEHEGEALARLRLPQAIHAGSLAHRVVQNGASLQVFEVHAHGLQDEQNVREQDGGVRADGVERRDGHLGGQIGRAAKLDKGDLLADGAVLAHVPARLAHEPYGRPGVLQPPAGAHEGGIRIRGRVLRCWLRRHEPLLQNIVNQAFRAVLPKPV